MSWSDAAVFLVAGAVLSGGVLVARTMGRMLVSMKARRQDELEHRGSVHGSDMILRVSLIVVWAGGAFGSLCLLPGVVWVTTGDREALEIATRLFGVSAVIAALGVLAALSGMRLWVLEPHQLTRSGPLRERSIRFDEVTRLREAGVFPALRVDGADTSIRLPKTIAGFDDVFNRLVEETGPDVVAPAGEPAATGPTGPTLGAPGERAVYAVSKRRLRITIGVLGALLVFFLAWPWGVVEGEHPIRDSFFFVGVGLFLWLMIVLGVGSETLQLRQPIELELGPQALRWRTLRDSWQERDRTELISASVETTIIYVKGQSGHRYPLRLRFTDGLVLEVDDFRARHLGSSTQLLGHDIRRRYVGTAHRTDEDHCRARDHLIEGRAAEQAGDTLAAVSAYECAIASWPDEANLALHRHAGELLRTQMAAMPQSSRHERAARLTIQSRAIGHYRAHVDHFPNDADAWQAIAATLAGGLRTDLADEATATAEQLLLTGRAESTEHLLPHIVGGTD